MAGLYVFAQTSMPKPPSLDLFETQVDFGDSLKGATLIKDEPQKAEEFAGGVQLISFSNNQKLGIATFGDECEVVDAKPSGKPNFLIADSIMSLSELFQQNVKPNNGVHIFGSFGVGENKLRKFNITPHSIVSKINTEYCCEELDYNNRMLRPGDVAYYYSFAQDFTGLDTQRCALSKPDVNPISFEGTGWFLNYLSSEDFLDALSNTQRLDTLFKVNDKTADSELFWPPTKDSLRIQQLRGSLRSQKKNSLIENSFEPGIYWIKLSSVAAPIDRRVTNPIPENTLRATLDDAGRLECDDDSITFDFVLESSSDFPILISGFNFDQRDRLNYQISYADTFLSNSNAGRIDINNTRGVIDNENVNLKNNGLLLNPEGQIVLNFTITLEEGFDGRELQLENVTLDAELIGAIPGLELNTEFSQSASIANACGNEFSLDQNNISFTCVDLRNRIFQKQGSIEVTNNTRRELNLDAANINGLNSPFLTLAPNGAQGIVLPGQNSNFEFNVNLDFNEYIDSRGEGSSSDLFWSIDSLTSNFNLTVESCPVNSLTAEIISVKKEGDQVVDVFNPSLSCNQTNFIALRFRNSGVNTINLSRKTFILDFVTDSDQTIQDILLVEEDPVDQPVVSEINKDNNKLFITFKDGLEKLDPNDIFSVFLELKLSPDLLVETQQMKITQLLSEVFDVNLVSSPDFRLACADVGRPRPIGFLPTWFKNIFSISSAFAQDLIIERTRNLNDANTDGIEPINLNCLELENVNIDLGLVLKGVFDEELGARIIKFLDVFTIFPDLEGEDQRRFLQDPVIEPQFSLDLTDLPPGESTLFSTVEFREFDEDFESAINLVKSLPFMKINNSCARLTVSANAEVGACSVETLNQAREHTVTVTIANPLDKDVLINAIAYNGSSMIEEIRIPSDSNDIVEIQLIPEEGVESLEVVYSIGEEDFSTTVSIRDLDTTACIDLIEIEKLSDLTCDAFHSPTLKDFLNDNGVEYQENYTGVVSINLPEGLTIDALKFQVNEKLGDVSTPKQVSEFITYSHGGPNSSAEFEDDFYNLNGDSQFANLKYFFFGDLDFNKDADYEVQFFIGDNSVGTSDDLSLECEGGVYWPLNPDAVSLPATFSEEYEFTTNDAFDSNLSASCDLEAPIAYYPFNYGATDLTFRGGGAAIPPLVFGGFGREDLGTLDTLRFDDLADMIANLDDLTLPGDVQEEWRLVQMPALEIPDNCPGVFIEIEKLNFDGVPSPEKTLECKSFSRDLESDAWSEDRNFIPNDLRLKVRNITGEVQHIPLSIDDETDLLEIIFDSSIEGLVLRDGQYFLTVNTGENYFDFDVLYKLAPTLDNLPDEFDFESLFDFSLDGVLIEFSNSEFSTDCGVADAQEVPVDACVIDPVYLNLTAKTPVDENFGEIEFNDGVASFTIGDLSQNKIFDEVAVTLDNNFIIRSNNDLPYDKNLEYEVIGSCFNSSIYPFGNVGKCKMPFNNIFLLRFEPEEGAENSVINSLDVELKVEDGFGTLGSILPVEFLLTDDDGAVISKNYFQSETATPYKILVRFDLNEPIELNEDLDLNLAIKYPPFPFASRLVLEGFSVNDIQKEFLSGTTVHFNYFNYNYGDYIEGTSLIPLNLLNREFLFDSGNFDFTENYCVQTKLFYADRDIQSFDDDFQLAFYNDGAYPVILDVFDPTVGAKTHFVDGFGANYDSNGRHPMSIFLNSILDQNQVHVNFATAASDLFYLMTIYYLDFTELLTEDVNGFINKLNTIGVLPNIENPQVLFGNHAIFNSSYIYYPQQYSGLGPINDASINGGQVLTIPHSNHEFRACNVSNSLSPIDPLNFQSNSSNLDDFDYDELTNEGGLDSNIYVHRDASDSFNRLREARLGLLDGTTTIDRLRQNWDSDNFYYAENAETLWTQDINCARERWY